MTQGTDGELQIVMWQSVSYQWSGYTKPGRNCTVVVVGIRSCDRESGDDVTKQTVDVFNIACSHTPPIREPTH